MTTTAISNTDNIINSRDVIARIEELASQLPETAHDVMPGTSDDIQEIKEELDILTALAAEASSSPDWEHGEALIHYSYFKEHAQELAEDCGMIQEGDQWPGRCIDWDQAAEELKEDYFAVDFDGVEYWIRG